ncbi:MAG TPA: MFS transporter [Candidatus Limnocylindria bacterium]|nr:MFS transporter [Candidatus Limnocylindria bacterium]
MSRDFWRFWVGETVSAFGSSFTQFAIPLLVFKLTGSAIYLAATFALFAVPHLLFGLIIGAWTDRTDRRRLMITVDLLAALTVTSVPVAAAVGMLSVWWVMVVIFIAGTLSIFFEAAQFGAVPSLVDQADLVTANGRIQASFAAATVAGPLVAGGLLVFLPVDQLLYIDAATFLGSAVALGLIRRPFNPPVARARTSLRADIVEGLRYVLGHPVLRNISAMMAMVNFVSASAFAQLVYFAKARYAASDSELGIIFAAGGVGVFLMSVIAGPLRKRWSFGNVALGALMLSGALIVALAFAPSFWIAVPLWGLSSGLGILFNINTGSLRQAIVPNQMLGRIITIAMVLAWSANPIGSMLGGVAIERTGDVQLVYAAIGVATFLIPLYFRLFSPLGHAERYLRAPEPSVQPLATDRV